MKLEMILMSLRWILRQLGASSRHTGFFGYLLRRDDNKTRIQLENARHQATTDLIDRLPRGALYREGTADGWREIQILDTARSSLFVLPTGHPKRPEDHHDQAELRQQRRALGRDDSAAR